MLISVMWYVSDYLRVHVAHTCIGRGQYNVVSLNKQAHPDKCLCVYISEGSVSHISGVRPVFLTIKQLELFCSFAVQGSTLRLSNMII